MKDMIEICCLVFVFSMTLKAEEYCQSETFSPSCQSDEVVLITKANYGRMKFGKCVKEEQQLKIIWNDPQYLGCSTDVIGFVSKHCTGKKDCQLKVSDTELEKFGSCYASLKMYLDVSYICIKVAQNNRQCAITLDGYGDIHVMKQHHEDGCGTKKHPWIVETMKGQTISVDSITTKSPENEQDLLFQHRMSCPDNRVEGYILDKSVNKNITLCSSQRSSYQYNSTANIVEIVFLHKAEGSPVFLKLKATGCSDLIPPADAWLKRTENEATIGCYSTRLRWQLKCQGQRWVGVIGNCSYVMDLVPETAAEKKRSSDSNSLGNSSQMFTVTVICACGIILCSLIVCVGIICLRRYSSRSKIVESILKEKIAVANGSLMKTSNPQQTAYSHYYDADVDKVSNGVPQIHGEYFVLDKDALNDHQDHDK